jgi:AAA+ ATPase superfamily predicted ATPase
MNPFAYGKIVRGEYFFDRKEECSHIIQTLSGGNNMVLFAPRRFGKTSLVFQAMEKLEKQGFICIYFDFMPVYSVESFIRLYTKALSAKQTNLNKFVKAFASMVKNVRPVLAFDSGGKPELSLDFSPGAADEVLVGQLFDMTETLGSKNKRVIVFFDEFQEAVKLQSVNFENLLRSKIQQQSRTNYLFFGSKTHLLNELFNNKKRAFYNSASQMTIGPLPQTDTIRYLQKKFATHNMILDEATAAYLITAAGAIPHYVQLLASELWQYMVDSKKEATKKMVDICTKQILALKGDYYMELFDRQSAGRKKLLQALTKDGKNIFSYRYINKYLLTSAATVQRAAKELVEDGIVEKTGAEYFISDPFFGRFVAGTM